ncbi:MAG: hypothetical protein LBS43_00520 [Prevotellaceae bacterium]|jgi:hypothetical protein|nr:hypothetical protein [Prevotellaceae bacterium]
MSVTTIKTGKSTTKSAINETIIGEISGISETEQCTLWSDIQKKYPHHWVLVKDPVFDEEKLILEKGIVLYASENRDDITVELKKIDRLFYAVQYTGEKKKHLFLL